MKDVKRIANQLVWLAMTAGALLLSQHALAVGTDANVTIANQAQVNYDVATIPQEVILSDPAGNSTPGLLSGASTTDFVVDNRVDFTLAEIGVIGATPVNPGQANAVTTFQLTNTGNATQDYALAAVNLVGVSVNSNVDTAEMSNLRVFADTNGSGDFNAGDAIFVDELAEDASILVFIVADAPTSLINGDVGNVELTATTHDSGTVGTLDALTTDDAGIPDSAATVEVVFADEGAGGVGDGLETAQDGYIVSSAALSITKTSRVLSDPFNLGANPKAIPGATIEYTITVQNTGAVDAEQVQIADVLDVNLTLLLGQYGGAGQDVQIDVGGGTTVTTCSFDAADVDLDGCGTAGATLTIDPVAGLTVGTVATDNPAVIRYQATIN